MARPKKNQARPKQPWTSKEEKALTDGVAKHGEGKWKLILDDPLYGSSLTNRSNVDLKDKWRNMSVSEHVSTRKRTNKTSCMEVINSLSVTLPDSSRRSSGKRRAPRYKAMIFEALSAFEDPSGTDVETIDSFLQGKYEVPKNFRRLLTGKLGKLMLSGELEMVNNRYKVKVRSSGGETSQEEDIMAVNRNNEQAGPQNRIEEEPMRLPDLNEEPQYLVEEQVGPQNHKQVGPLNLDLNEVPVEPLPAETLEGVASVAAFQMDLAETSVSRVIKGCQDKNKLDDLLDESESMLMLVQGLYDKCRKDGTVILPP